jgi:hypothetical protein
MTIRQVVGGMLVLAALVGCAAAPQPLPPGLTADEVDAIRAAEQETWWRQIAPGEPMPVIEVVQYVDDNDSSALADCVAALEIPGVTVIENNGFSFDGDVVTQRALERAYFVCAQMYPTTPPAIEESGYYSQEQLKYLYDDFSERLVPCLRMMGFDATDPPVELFDGSGYLRWDPYSSLVRNPAVWDASLWALIDVRCPPPAIGQFWRLGEDS